MSHAKKRGKSVQNEKRPKIQCKPPNAARPSFIPTKVCKMQACNRLQFTPAISNNRQGNRFCLMRKQCLACLP